MVPSFFFVFPPVVLQKEKQEKKRRKKVTAFCPDNRNKFLCYLCSFLIDKSDRANFVKAQSNHESFFFSLNRGTKAMCLLDECLKATTKTGNFSDSAEKLNWERAKEKAYSSTTTIAYS